MREAHSRQGTYTRRVCSRKEDDLCGGLQERLQFRYWQGEGLHEAERQQGTADAPLTGSGEEFGFSSSYSGVPLPSYKQDTM